MSIFEKGIGGEFFSRRIQRGGEFVRGDYIGVANTSGAKSTTAIGSGAKNSRRIRQATVSTESFVEMAAVAQLFPIFSRDKTTL